MYSDCSGVSNISYRAVICMFCSELTTKQPFRFDKVSSDHASACSRNCIQWRQNEKSELRAVLSCFFAKMPNNRVTARNLNRARRRQSQKMRRKAVGIRYVCPLCMAIYGRSHDLRRHLRRDHEKGSDDLKEEFPLLGDAFLREANEEERSRWPVRVKDEDLSLHAVEPVYKNITSDESESDTSSRKPVPVSGPGYYFSSPTNRSTVVQELSLLSIIYR